MVAHLVRLKLTLLRNSLKRSPWQLVGLIIGGLYGLGMLVTVIVALAALGTGEAEFVGTAVCPGRRRTDSGLAGHPRCGFRFGYDP